ncbi:MAG: aminoglycoside phosphotransferase family protein [Chloroflexota bacterium]
MLEKPDIPDDYLLFNIRDTYNIPFVELSFLSIGADANSAVYHAVTTDGAPYFLKLRRGFDKAGVLVPRLLHERGSTNVIPPLPTGDNRLWTDLDEYTVILYPYVAGHDGYDTELSDAHWLTFGTAVRDLHDLSLPSDLAGLIPRETYTGRWRDLVRLHLSRLDGEYCDPTAIDMAAYLRSKRDEVLRLVDRTEALAEALMAQPPELVLCHADLHAGNVLISQGQLYIVDWDTLLLAPRERDLMFPGGAQGFRGHSPDEEEALFYQGYGLSPRNQQALAYYRGERIVEDIAVECEQVFGLQAGEADRAQEFSYLRRNFAPDGTLAAAYRIQWR